jgi:hypothetical protein
VPYQPLWPDGNTKLRPTPIQFSSPLTGSGYNVKYARAAFEADLRRIEDPTVCDRFTGAGCTLMITFPGSPQAGSICLSTVSTTRPAPSRAGLGLRYASTLGRVQKGQAGRCRCGDASASA